MPKAATPAGDDGVEVIDLADPTADPTKTAAVEQEDDGSTPDTPAQIAARTKAVKDVAAEVVPEVDPDADPAADPAATPPKGAKPLPTMIPAGRFTELNDRMKELEAQNKLLVAAALANKPAAATPPPPAVPEFDLKKAMKDQLAALASGDDDKALDLTEQIYKHQLGEARKQAKAEVEEATTALTARQQQEELTRAGVDIKKAYPELDGKSDKANEDAITFVIAKRDLLVGKGMLAHNALRDASEQAAKLFGFGKPATADPVADDPTTARTIAARTKAAAALAASPPDLTGVGDRATQPARLKVQEMTDAQLKALPKAELDKLDGSA